MTGRLGGLLNPSIPEGAAYRLWVNPGRPGGSHSAEDEPRNVSRFLGVDHVDARVRSLAEAEPFYDRFLPALGLGRKSPAFVDERGEWTELPDGAAPNVAEYYETPEPGSPARFIGIIEDPRMVPPQTRIAFAVADQGELEGWFGRLQEMGARHVEWSADRAAYPAIFFEDPCGTKLELCARRP
jgi:catechol 2,3-dioxygenase-like lactoylglutathione lyase family enzyme